LAPVQLARLDVQSELQAILNKLTGFQDLNQLANSLTTLNALMNTYYTTYAIQSTGALGSPCSGCAAVMSTSLS
jgi:hypothetical protein